jgi:hypothetical protein
MSVSKQIKRASTVFQRSSALFWLKPSSLAIAGFLFNRRRLHDYLGAAGFSGAGGVAGFSGAGGVFAGSVGALTGGGVTGFFGSSFLQPIMPNIPIPSDTIATMIFFMLLSPKMLPAHETLITGICSPFATTFHINFFTQKPFTLTIRLPERICTSIIAPPAVM